MNWYNSMVMIQTKGEAKIKQDKKGENLKKLLPPKWNGAWTEKKLYNLSFSLSYYLILPLSLITLIPLFSLCFFLLSILCFQWMGLKEI